VSSGDKFPTVRSFVTYGTRNDMSRSIIFLLGLLVSSSCTSAQTTVTGPAQSLCNWTVETPAVDGKAVRFTALYMTDFQHGSLLYDPACEFGHGVDVWVSKLSDGSYDKFKVAVRTDFHAGKSFDYKVEVSGTLRVAPPSGAIMDPGRDRPSLVIEIERVWSFERGPCTKKYC